MRRPTRWRLAIRCGFSALLGLALLPAFHGASWAAPRRVPAAGEGLLPTEKLDGTGVWVDPRLEKAVEGGRRVRATIWFEDQFLGDGAAYMRRAQEFADARRTELGPAVVRTLKALADGSWKDAKKDLDALLADGGIQNVDRFWIVNGFACGVTAEGLAGLKKARGVRKVFSDTSWRGLPPPTAGEVPNYPAVESEPFDPVRFKHPWYVRYLLADRVWKEFGVTGKGVLNVVHDHNFVYSPNVIPNLHRNAGEVPGNGKDDDGNGLVDDVHGWNFDRDDQTLTTVVVPPAGGTGADLHGFICGAIVCGRGVEGAPYEFGIAPESTIAGVISSRRMEAAVQWAIEQGADTYSMSFSVPDKGEHRSHWRKAMEHGSFCGLFFASGAGNFALQTEVPVQMRQPEDIPNAVFAAAGVHRDLSRTATSSQGPVQWDTEHYTDGSVRKPAVCAFNYDLPWLFRDGSVREGGLNGNSFAGPMFCGSIALMLSADPDLLPWDLREIITGTALDVAAEGMDDQTGHGLINCYRAVKEVLRRKAAREGRPTARYTGREKGDELDVKSLGERLEIVAVVIGLVAPKGQAAAAGVQVGDELLAYDGGPVRTTEELRERIAAAVKAAKSAGGKAPGTKGDGAAGGKIVVMQLRRGNETLEIELNSGPIGIRGIDQYNEPVFQ